MRDLWQDINLEVRGERVGQPHVPWERAENQVPHLNAVERDDIAERVEIVAQELREVVEEDQQHPQCPLVAETHKTMFVILISKHFPMT